MKCGPSVTDKFGTAPWPPVKYSDTRQHAARAPKATIADARDALILRPSDSGTSYGAYGMTGILPSVDGVHPGIA